MEKKVRILIETEIYSQSAQMTYEAFKSFEPYANFTCQIKFVKDVKSVDIENSDIVIGIRALDSLSTNMARICKKYHRLHFLTLDDNLFRHSRKDHLMHLRQEELKKVLSMTDGVIVCNKLFGKFLEDNFHIQKWGICDTAVQKELITEYKKTDLNKNAIKIAYYSNDGSSTYFRGIFDQIIEKLDTETKKKIEIYCIGISDLSYSAKNISFIPVPHLSLDDFRKYLANCDFDFGLAPIHEPDGFAEYKYFNKFMEFSKAGIPGIYSDVPPNNFVVKDHNNGILCKNNAEEWLNAIISLSNDCNLRNSLIENAQETLKTQFSVQSVYSQLVSAFPELNTYHAPQVKIKNWRYETIKYDFFKFEEKISSVCEYLKKGGIKAVFDRTKYYLKVKKDFRNEFVKTQNTNK